jgi:cell division protein FtsA
MTLVAAPILAVAALVDCIAEAGLRVSRVIASPYAAGLAVLSPEERAMGAVALDCGATQVGIAGFVGGHLVLADSGPIGGAALTQDIAMRLGATFAAAERVKLAHGGFSHAPPAEIPVEAPAIGPDGRLEARVVSRGSIIEAMGPRLEEMLAAVGVRLRSIAEREGAKPWRAALTGGGAQLSGLRDLAEPMLNRPVRIGRPVGFGALDQGPQAHGFAVAAGLLRFEVDPPAEAIGAPEAAAATPAPKAHIPPLSTKVGGAMSKALGWLKENF